jgi:hypothetical protein
MALALHPNPASAPARRKTDHLVMNGQLEVGRIYKRDTPDKSDSQWLWAINGVPLAAAGVMRVAGIAASFEQAKAELQENWEKWLAWANLQEIGGTVPLQPVSTPVASEEIGGSVPLQPASTLVASEEIGETVPLRPEPTPAASDLAQREPDIAGDVRLSETSLEPARIGQADGAGRRRSPRRRKSK